MRGRERLLLTARMRSRRGALSVLLILAIVTGVGFLPAAARLGAIPSAQIVGRSHLVDGHHLFINATMNDTAPGFYFDNDVWSANTTLSLHLTNTGNTTHSFSLYNRPNEAISTTPEPSPSQLNVSWMNQTSPANVWLPAKAQANLTLNLSVPGSYEILSLVPYQFQAGLYVFVHVLPSGSATEQYAYTNSTGALTFTPNLLVVAPNVPVVFNVTAIGGGHTFTLDGCSNDSEIVTGVALPGNDPCLGTSPTYDEALVNLQLNTAGASYTSAPVILKPGIYWFFCTIPGHFAAGMWGKVYVGIPAQPAGNTPQVTSVIQLGYLALMVTVIGCAALLILLGQAQSAPPPTGPIEHH